MNEIWASSIANVSAHLKHFADVTEKESQRGTWSAGEQAKLKEQLGVVLPDLDLIGLDGVKTLCQLAINEIESCQPIDAKGRAFCIRDLFNGTLQAVWVLLLTEKESEFFKTDSPLDPVGVTSVRDSFPRATDEARRAARCYALNQPTACVFHLMRVMEVALRVFFTKGMSLPDPTSDRERNWGHMLRRVKDSIDANNNPKGTPPQNWSSNKEFCENAYAFFEAIRNPWRNSTMHVERDYSPTEALEIYNAVSTFMRCLSTKLAE